MEDADAVRIQQYLHHCYERRTLSHAQKGYFLDDFTFIITLSIGDDIKQILLGEKTSFTDCGYGTLKYNIVKPDPILIDIKKILELPDE